MHLGCLNNVLLANGKEALHQVGSKGCSIAPVQGAWRSPAKSGNDSEAETDVFNHTEYSQRDSLNYTSTDSKSHVGSDSSRGAKRSRSGRVM